MTRRHRYNIVLCVLAQVAEKGRVNALCLNESFIFDVFWKQRSTLLVVKFFCKH